MTRKTLVSTLILTLTLSMILLKVPETAETQEPPTEPNGAAHGFHASDYVQQGRQHVAVGDYASAIANFDKALQIAPEDPAAYYYRASAKFEWGKSEQGTHAKRLYHAAIEDYSKPCASRLLSMPRSFPEDSVGRGSGWVNLKWHLEILKQHSTSIGQRLRILM